MGRTTKALADALAAELGVPTRTARRFVQRLFELVEEDLVESSHVELRGLGTFSLSTRRAHTVKHPQTRRTVRIPARRFVRFRSSAALRRRLNPSAGRRKGEVLGDDRPGEADGAPERMAEGEEQEAARRDSGFLP